MFRLRSSWVIALAIAGLMRSPIAHAQLVVGVSEDEEYVKFIDVATNTPTDLFRPLDSVIGGAGGDGPEGIAADNANRLFYWQYIDNLYRTYWDNKDANGYMISEKIADMQCTTCTSVTSMDGITYVNGILYGVRNLDSATSGLEGIYTIDPGTGVATLIFEFASDPGIGDDLNIDARGLCQDPNSGLFYFYNNDNNDANSGLNGQGAGIYSIDIDNVLGGGAFAIAMVGPTPTITSLCSNCGTDGFPDIDGMVLGNGKIYLLTDQPGDFLVFDIATSLFELNILNPWTTTETAAGGTWAPDANGPPAGVADLSVSLSATHDGLDFPSGLDVGLGEQIVYTLTNYSNGALDATSMSYELNLSGTAGINIVSAIGTASSPTIMGNTVSGSLAPFNVGSQETVTITVDTVSAGTLSATATVAAGGSPADTIQINNVKTHNGSIRVFPDVNALFFANLTAIGGSSAVPGQPFNFLELSSSSSNAFRQISRSPDGNYIVFLGHNNTGSSTDDMVMLGHNGTYEMIAQQATTPAPNGELMDSMILTPLMSVNNAGQVAFANDTLGSTSTDETIIRYNGDGTFALIAQEDSVVPVYTAEGLRYDGDMDSPMIDSNGDVSFRLSTLLNAATTENQVVLGTSGNSVIAREGLDIPLNQAGGGTLPWETFDSETFWADATGSNWLVQGDLTGTSGDDILVVNGSVVLQEGQGVPGLTGTIPTPGTSAGIIFPRMFSNGDWSCRGTTSDSDQDFVVIGNGTTFSVFAKWGDELETGSGETWSDADGWSRTFFAVARNNQGDTVLSGRTSNPNLGRNAAAVLYRDEDGTKSVVLREGDPIDLNGNGIFDDNAWLRSFVEGEAVLTDAGEFIAHVEYTDSSAPDSTGSVTGKAIVHLMVNASPQAAGADIFVTKTADTSFVDHVGGAITYTVNVCNQGPNDATNVMMNDTLPAEVTFSSATNGAMESGGVVTANIGTLAPFECATFEITVVTNAEGTPTNTASATTSTSDPDMMNNSGSAEVTIENQVDVGLSKIDNGGAPVGQQYDYTITATNAGPAPATNVLVRDSLPAQVSFVTASLPFVQNGQDIDVTIPNIPVGGQVEYTITVTALAQALVTNNLTLVSLDQVDTNAANDTFSLDTINGFAADLSITKVDSGLTNLGDDITYTLEVANAGPAEATDVVVTEFLPAGITLVSVSTAYNDLGGGTIEITYPSIASQASEQITIVVTPLSAATYTNTVTVTANEVDPDDGNNSALTLTRVGDFRDVTVVYTEISGDPTAVVPGARDVNGDLTFAEFNSVEDLEVSPDGTAWFLQASNNLGSDLSDLLMIGGGTTGDVLAQEGQTVPGGDVGEVWDFMDGNAGFNNVNDLAFNARARGGSSTLDNEKVMSRINGVVSLEFQQGDTLTGALTTGDVPAPDALIGNSIGLVHLLDDGRIGWYCTPITNVSSFYYPLLGYDLTVYLQSRANQIDGVNWDSFDSSDAFRTTPDGMHTLILGDDEGSTTSDLVLVYDGVVVLREGNPIGSIGTLADVFATKLAANGDWFARGDDAANDDWAVRNGVIIAETGASVLGGAETWGDTLTIVNGNRVGDYIVGGNTSEPDTDFDTVLVMNGDTLVLREGDPIDLDGNGAFDDNVFIGAFQADDSFITDDRLLLSLITLRNSEGTSLGDAFIQVDLSTGGCPTVAGDVDGDGDGDGADVQGATECILTGGASGGACACIDYDSSGMSDVGDIAAFVADLLDN